MFADLDRSVRGRLRTLSKDNADGVGRHLVMVGRLLDTDPELAYEHAQAAVRRAGRVDVVREAAGLAAYRTERYAEALRELRTVRRLNGSSEHLAIMADCERGLGRPERALALAQEPEAATLDAEAQIELAMVVSGARLDLGQPEAALAALSTDAVRSGTGTVAVRVAQARATALEASGLVDEAAAELAKYTQDELDEAAGNVEPDEEFVSFDLSEFDAEGEYEDYPYEPSGDAGTSESVEAGLAEDDDEDEALAEAEALLDDDASDDDASDDAESGQPDDESGAESDDEAVVDSTGPAVVDSDDRPGGEPGDASDDGSGDVSDTGDEPADGSVGEQGEGAR